MFGNDLLGLSSTISPFNDTQPDDVIKTKSALALTGHYQIPDFGITPYPDTPMIDGIKKFQKDNGLKVDGVMKPQGPTETALGSQSKSISTVNPFAASQEEKKLSTPKPPKIDPLTGLPEQKAPKLKMPTAKQWEQVAKIQKPKTAIVPEGNTVNQRIQSMMSDPRYQDKFDTRLRDHVQKQFQKAYPGTVEYDETGKMVQPVAVISPEDVDPYDPDGELQFQTITNNINNQQSAENSVEFIDDVTEPDEKISQNDSYDEQREQKEGSEDMQMASSGTDIEDAVADANSKWPNAKIRITGRARTVNKQATLMAKRRMASREDFMGTYTNHDYIKEMDQYVTDNPNASLGTVTSEFERIIRAALAAGYKVSDHLSDTARDVSIPRANKSDVRTFFENSGIRVLDESGASSGAHWHLDYQ
ncbi:hypothetical protein GCM10011332_26220 [Terasakiella brassicae]|uniref:Peptidoglycan binding-like domain-containing protein n=1 Tax=Terasakiella brassicae TaxID=1634917 RepID=A0A917C436_9PROT|nr:hypothetical protein [Terasakiella brassicae]GGF71006.1 hypothetical protein GCM10011332_26220 [Terasakiella brassicae]